MLSAEMPMEALQVSGLNPVVDVGVLYEAHGRWLQGWLRAKTRCSSRAADLAQDTFCRLLETPQNVALREPRNYLATLARRILIDDIRRRDIERAYLAAYALDHEGSDPITPERIVEAVQLLDAIMRLLEKLPEKARIAFMMVRFDGERYDAVAAHLGVSVRMAKRYVAQAYVHCYKLAFPD
ncbi:sigma-70 family RNA polymerase sigma factor [Novosphingobium terrae]|uniref:sigma-70 family RNA polymerase sigma factor n=1 Tax=Novosphingobium terrae TaxID=2726189 RepID=UPI001F12F123|nr:sigma-70 family RNA polymerase sigma factor [Novosphingobium terrae]